MPHRDRGVGMCVAPLLYHVSPAPTTLSAASPGHVHPPTSPLSHGDVRATHKCKFLDDQATVPHSLCLCRRCAAGPGDLCAGLAGHLHGPEHRPPYPTL